MMFRVASDIESGLFGAYTIISNHVCNLRFVVIQVEINNLHIAYNMPQSNIM